MQYTFFGSLFLYILFSIFYTLTTADIFNGSIIWWKRDTNIYTHFALCIRAERFSVQNIDVIQRKHLNENRPKTKNIGVRRSPEFFFYVFISILFEMRIYALTLYLPIVSQPLKFYRIYFTLVFVSLDSKYWRETLMYCISLSNSANLKRQRPFWIRMPC